MATGDQSDFLARLQGLLPSAWYPTEAPVRDALLTALAASWTTLWTQQQYVSDQTRIATATDIFLDLIATDYLGPTFVRQPGELDAVFRARIQRELLAPRGTRAALVEALTNLTGNAPTIFEPAYAYDTGGYGVASSLGYGVAGGYGSYSMPFEFFVNVNTSASPGIANVQGYGPVPAGGQVVGGYGVGAIVYASLAQEQSTVTDAEIYATINETIPAGTVAWTAITE